MAEIVNESQMVVDEVDEETLYACRQGLGERRSTEWGKCGPVSSELFLLDLFYFWCVACVQLKM